VCGRFVAATDPDGLVRFFSVDDRQGGPVPPSWNVAPTDAVNAVAAHERRRVLVKLRWGLVPAWADDPRIGPRLINARSETVAERPAFKDAFARRRCLVPADGFYEWSAEHGAKIPYYIHRSDGRPVAFGGLWSVWRDRRDPDRPPLRTCTILTTAAADELSWLHDRMPAILPADRWDDWLDPDADPAPLRGLLVPAAGWVTRRVSRAVSDPRNNGPALIEEQIR
jgi:putative SOS response-associated peptidase YedK